jgi:cell shape-determining protein MreC
MRGLSTRGTFWALMALSIILMWLPGVVSAPIRNFFDTILAPLGSPLHQVGQDVRQGAERFVQRPRDGRSWQQLADRIAELERYLLHERQSSRIDRQLRAESANMREELLGTRGRLISARVLLRDSVAWRESFLIDRPPDVESARQWVVGRLFVDRGGIDGVSEKLPAVMRIESDTGREALHRSVLIGWVERVGRMTARVRLLTDPDSVMTARVLHRDRRRNEFLHCQLKGMGPGRLVAETVHRGRTAAGERITGPPVLVGDVVVSSDQSPDLRAPLLIGRITKVQESERHPGVYTCQVQPAIDYSRLRRVWVVDPDVVEGGD